MPADAPQTSEPERLLALQRLALLDTAPEERFDRITRLAVRLLDAPIAMLNLVDADRLFVKSAHGTDVREMPRDGTFCGHTIGAREPLIVEDALFDHRFAAHPEVAGGEGLRFYAGVALVDPDGRAMGTLCVLDRRARDLDASERAVLADLSRLAEHELTADPAATIDPLTGLSNWLGFSTLAMHALALCTRLGRPAALVCYDIDRLAEVNARHGRDRGDAMLAEFADLLKHSHRGRDVVGRLRSDTFMALLTDSDERATRLTIQRTRWMAAERDRRAGRADSEDATRFRAGVARYAPGQGDSVKSLLIAAYRRMIEDRSPG